MTVSVYHTNVLVAIFTNLTQKIFHAQKLNVFRSYGSKLLFSRRGFLDSKEMISKNQIENSNQFNKIVIKFTLNRIYFQVKSEEKIGIIIDLVIKIFDKFSTNFVITEIGFGLLKRLNLVNKNTILVVGRLHIRAINHCTRL